MKGFFALAAIIVLWTHAIAIPVADTAGVPLVKADFDLERREEQRQRRGDRQYNKQEEGLAKRLDHSTDEDGEHGDSPMADIEKRMGETGRYFAKCNDNPKNCNKVKRHAHTDEKDNDEKRELTAASTLSKRGTKQSKKSSGTFFVYE